MLKYGIERNIENHSWERQTITADHSVNDNQRRTLCFERKHKKSLLLSEATWTFSNKIIKRLYFYCQSRNACYAWDLRGRIDSDSQRWISEGKVWLKSTLIFRVSGKNLTVQKINFAYLWHKFRILDLSLSSRAWFRKD